MKTLSSWLMAGIALVLSGCATPAAPLAEVAEYAPVAPQVQPAPVAATGAIYNPGRGSSLLGRGRQFQVGDVITVLLDEFTQAEREQNTEIERTGNNNVMPGGLAGKVAAMGGMLGGFKLDGGTIGSSGGGVETKGARLRGAVSVHVLEVLPNGNLVVRGEKQLSLSDGAEAIQVAGIIRPTDVSYNNTVQSGRLANAQFNYKGSGDLANSSKPGWGTRALMKIWPF